MNAWLELSTKRIEIHNDFSIGRIEGNSLRLDNKRVSKRHALIHCQGNSEFWLIDQGSTNGTFVNKRRVTGPIKLANGDTLEIGDDSLQFRALEPIDDAPVDLEAEDTCCQTLPAAPRTELVWMMVADIEEFTQLSQSMTEVKLAQCVGKWISDCRRIVETHGGSINKYLGDGFLAYWPNSDMKAADIDVAIRRFQTLQSQGNHRFRIVLHHAQVTISPDMSERAEELIGPQLNFLFRLEKVAAKLRSYCLISSDAAEHLKHFGRIESCGAHKLKGFSGEFEAFSYHPT